jgi:endonuclease/exonuclease/phosphatase family metal-dependent hydrolase
LTKVKRVTLLLALLLGYGCQAPIASGRATQAGVVASPAAAVEPVVIRVLTYNIRHGQGRDRVTDLTRTAEVMKGVRPDIVALQEVDRGTERSGGADQLAALGGLMGMHAAYGKAIDYDGGEYGVAVLSRWVIERTETHSLPAAAGTEQRTALTVWIRAGESGPVVRLTSTHLSQNWEPDNTLAQVRRLNELLATDDVGGVLAGDINTATDSDAMRVLEMEWTIAAAAAPGPTPPCRPRPRPLSGSPDLAQVGAAVRAATTSWSDRPATGACWRRPSSMTTWHPTTVRS